LSELSIDGVRNRAGAFPGNVNGPLVEEKGGAGLAWALLRFLFAVLGLATGVVERSCSK
jgi:hypothetical protein